MTESSLPMDDTNKPNAARIYDYLLGGSHNFAADQAAGERIAQIFPSIRHGSKLNRWFMYAIVQDLAKGNFNCYIDLATGLPTEGYLHELVPSSCKILYNDQDPITVAYGEDIIKSHKNVTYKQSRIQDIDAILEAAEKHFGGERCVAICFVGVAYFLNDEEVKRVTDRLYEWCAPGSRLATSWLQLNADHPRIQELKALYEQLRSPAYGRTPEEVKQLLSPWHIDEPGLLPLNEWVVPDLTVPWYDADDAGMAQPFGCIATKL